MVVSVRLYLEFFLLAFLGWIVALSDDPLDQLTLGTLSTITSNEASDHPPAIYRIRFWRIFRRND